MQDRGRIFWMELRSDIPTVGWYLYDLHKIGCRVGAHAFHPVALKLVFVSVVEFVAVAVTLLDEGLFTIGFVSEAAFGEFALVTAQPHRATHLRDALLFLHQVDDGMCC